jgi:undecaprenyl-diphosphatase
VARRFAWGPVIALAVSLLSFVLLSAALTHGKSTPFDETVRAALHSLATPALTLLMRAITALGSQAFLLSVSGCAVILMFLLGFRRDAWLLIVGMAGAELLLAILKVEFHRQRPEPFFGEIASASYSFPSGHAMLSFCCYGLLALFGNLHLSGRARRLAQISAVALILLIGISRIYLGVHHATDVIAGYLIGTVWIAALLAGLGRV